jgi:hypothetical protein
MRRLALVTVAATIGLMSTALAAHAREPSPSPGAAGPSAASPAETVCTVSDSKITELSGLVATDSGYIVVNDSNPDAAAMKVFFLDSTCKPKSTVVYESRPLDPEDLAVAPDGTIWVADIGDNAESTTHRSRIALWKVPSGGTGKATIYRLTYPAGDGPHDAEALLINGDGTPIVVTKELGGKSAGVYVPTAPLEAGTPNGVPMKKAGEFKPNRTGTSNPLGVVGQTVVTGGANAPDGKRVVLRTYADAYEFDVPDGDVVKAITTGTPRVTPLPDEPLGEAITYTRDGKSFLTVSDREGPAKILRYAPAAPAGPSKAPAGASSKRGGPSWFDKLSLQDITYLVAGVGVLGLLLVVVGVVGIRRSRQARRLAAAGSVRGVASVGDDLWSEDGDEYPDRAEHGTVYGGRGYAENGYGQNYGDGYESGYDQGGYGQGDHDQGRYDQRGYDQGGYPAGYAEADYAQSGYAEPGYGQQGYQEPGYGQPGQAQPGYGQPEYGQPGYDQSGYPQPGHAQPGPAQPGHPHDYDDYNPYAPRR